MFIDLDVNYNAGQSYIVRPVLHFCIHFIIQLCHYILSYVHYYDVGLLGFIHFSDMIILTSASDSTFSTQCALHIVMNELMRNE